MKKQQFIITLLSLIVITTISGCEKNDSVSSDSNSRKKEWKMRLNLPLGYKPPVLQIENPPAGTILPMDSTSVTVTGTVTAGDSDIAALLVNGNETEIGPDNFFSVKVPVDDRQAVYFSVDIAAIDTMEYCTRKRVSLIRGNTSPVEELVERSVGVKLDSQLFSRLPELSSVINYLLAREELVQSLVKALFAKPVVLEVNEPVHAVIEITLNTIVLHNNKAVQVKELRLLDDVGNQGTGDKAALRADLALKGIELDVSLKPLEIATVKLPENGKPVHIRAIARDMNAQADLRLGAASPASVSLELLDLTTKVTVMDIIVPDTGIFNEDNPIKIRDFMAYVFGTILSTILDHATIPVNLPQGPINLSMLNPLLEGIEIPGAEGTEPLSMASLLGLDFAALNISYGLGSLKGDSSDLELQLNLAPWVVDEQVDGINYRNYDRALSLPPTGTVEEALTPTGDSSDIAVAISQDFLNRMFTSLVDMDLSLAIPSSDALMAVLPILGPGSTLRLAVNTPPVLRIDGGQVLVALPNIMLSIYEGGSGPDSLRLQAALDLEASLVAGITEVNSSHYLDFNLNLSKVDDLVILDRMGITSFGELSVMVKDVMLPQITALLRKALETPLSLSAEELLACTEPYGQVPAFDITISELRMDGGYLSIFIDFQ